ncbi:ATPases of ABC transporters with duplicated ATPase domains-containing protein [Haemophilus influenzae]|uniref:ATPases of ABC transporters with duplicated ATPase domains-containing protein n=1 Tax=Haemophilus influenzae TaxID=727 RepID=A0A2X1PL97_HAEIF|nr:ATPases of ABC transporters with duplicated ATPase domains-containing protein [Haemophilus influenzae]
MNKIFVILTALILSGCATKLTQLNVPTQLEYNGKHYVLTGSQDFETIARYVYIAKPDTLENWQSEIEILFDRNQSERSIKERIALRERIYRNTGVKDFHFDAIPKKFDQSK